MLSNPLDRAHGIGSSLSFRFDIEVCLFTVVIFIILVKIIVMQNEAGEVVDVYIPRKW